MSQHTLGKHGGAGGAVGKFHHDGGGIVGMHLDLPPRRRVCPHGVMGVHSGIDLPDGNAHHETGGIRPVYADVQQRPGRGRLRDPSGGVIRGLGHRFLQIFPADIQRSARVSPGNASPHFQHGGVHPVLIVDRVGNSGRFGLLPDLDRPLRGQTHGFFRVDVLSGGDGRFVDGVVQNVWRTVVNDLDFRVCHRLLPAVRHNIRVIVLPCSRDVLRPVNDKGADVDAQYPAERVIMQLSDKSHSDDRNIQLMHSSFPFF